MAAFLAALPAARDFFHHAFLHPGVVSFSTPVQPGIYFSRSIAGVVHGGKQFSSVLAVETLKV
jgi:hypothetical protein